MSSLDAARHTQWFCKELWPVIADSFGGGDAVALRLPPLQGRPHPVNIFQSHPDRGFVRPLMVQFYVVEKAYRGVSMRYTSTDGAAPLQFLRDCIHNHKQGIMHPHRLVTVQRNKNDVPLLVVSFDTVGLVHALSKRVAAKQGIGKVEQGQTVSMSLVSALDSGVSHCVHLDAEEE